MVDARQVGMQVGIRRSSNMFISTSKGIPEQAVTTVEPNMKRKVLKRKQAYLHFIKELTEVN